jgi:hypothetical protein
MKFKSYHLFIVALVVAASACRKAPGPVLNLAIATPSSLNVSLKQSTVTASWKYTGNKPAAGFIAQLAKDADFKQIIGSDTVGATTTSVSFDSVGYITECYFRVMSVAQDIVKNSPFAVVKLAIGNILLPVDTADLTATSVTLRWTAPTSGTVTDVVLIPQDSAARAPVALTAADTSAYAVTISDLANATTYTAVLYDGDVRKGVVTFTTDDLSAKIIINSGKTVYASLQDAIDAAQSGDVIKIKGSFDFSAAGAVTIDKSLTIQALDDEDIPTISTGIINLSGDVGDLTFENINLVDNGLHALDASGLAGTADVTLKNCDISGCGAGLIYTSSSSSSATVGLTVDNCIIHDIGNSGGDFIDFRAGTLTGLKVSNSTFCNLARAFLRIDNGVQYTGSDSLSFANCTINNVCNGGRFLYVRAGNIKLSFSKCILTNEVSNQSNGTPPTVATGCDEAGSNSDSFLKYATLVGNLTLDPQYSDAAKEDFTVGNATVKAAKIGDPRWLP